MLIGLIDPSHDERADDEPGRLPKWFSLAEVLAKAARAEPEWSPWPYEMLRAAVEQYQERDYISVSMLTGGCPRGKVIERREEFILNVDDMYPALRGTQLHRTMEGAARPNSVAEWRFFKTITLPKTRVPIELSCSPDLVTWDPNTLIDYKVTENPPDYYPYKGQTKQVQFNAWLVKNADRWVGPDGLPADIPFNPHTWTPEHLALVYLGPKGPKVLEVKKMRDTVSPKTKKPIRRRMPYIWSDDEVTDDLYPRLRAMAEALDAYPEWPFGNKYADETGKEPGDSGFGGPPGWGCPGYPWCSLPKCMAKRYPNGLKWAAA